MEKEKHQLNRRIWRIHNVRIHCIGTSIEYMLNTSKAIPWRKRVGSRKDFGAAGKVNCQSIANLDIGTLSDIEDFDSTVNNCRHAPATPFQLLTIVCVQVPIGHLTVGWIAI
jgi:hypothetical protein